MGKGRFVNQKLAKRTGHVQRQQKLKLESRRVFQGEFRAGAFDGNRKSHHAIIEGSVRPISSPRDKIGQAIEET